MKKAVIILSVLLLVFTSANAIAAQYDFFGGFIPEGTPSIDGVITAGEWNETGHRTLYKFFGEDSKIDIYLMWDKNNLYVAADIEDYTLWVDNYDPSKAWESTWNDDAFKIEIDPDFSRHENLQAGDRVFAINANGSASRFDQGDGAGSTVGATIIDTIQKAVKYSGTLNDYTFKTITTDAQKDGGFVVEVAIPWKNLFGSASAVAPSDGYSMGMNFTNIDDDVSGQLDAAYYKEWKRVYDEITRFMGEEGRPENWAEFVLSSNNDTTPPAAITGLTTSSTSAYSTIINFTATGDNDTSGYAKSYDIRYSTSAISESNWNTAVVYSNSFRPQKAGKSESFKLVGFTPNITYYLGIKAIDERGNSSHLATAGFTTLSASSASDKGFITVCPGQRYFCRENGSPVVIVGDNQGMPWPYIRTFYNGQMWDQSMGKYRNFYQEEGPQTGRDYLKKLSGYGVNTLRIMAEAYDIDNPVYLTTSVSGGPSNITFNQDTLNFLKTFLDECAKYDINVIIVPFDTFYYKEKWSKVTFSASKGGPMSSSSDMFNSSYRDYLKAILNKLVQTIGDRKNLLAWDLMNEFDSDDPDFGWNSATFSAREDTLNALVDYMRGIDPNHMVYASSVRWDPKFSAHLDQSLSKSAVGSDAAVILNNRRFDFNSTHTYYHDIRDPNYNDPNNLVTPYFTYQVSDLDNTIAPAARIKQGLQFYYANAVSPKPYLDTEAGPIKFFIKAYDQFFTKEDDYQYFHNMIWAHLASGDAGTGLRWPGDMFSDHALPDQMRKYQKALKGFASDKLDFTAFNPVQIGQYMEVGNTTIPVIKTGITDGYQGIVFLVKDTRKSTYNAVSGASLTIPKLSAGKLYTIEFWDSYNPDATGPSSSVSSTSDAQGKAVVNLPDFSKTLAIKFYTNANTCSATVSPELRIHIPILTYSGGSYWADFQYAQGMDFSLTSAGALTSTGRYSTCNNTASLSSDLKLNIPELTYNGGSYWANFQYAQGLNFTLTEVGAR